MNQSATEAHQPEAYQPVDYSQEADAADVAQAPATRDEHGEANSGGEPYQDWAQDADNPSETSVRAIVAAFLIGLAVLWTGAVAWAAGQAVSTGPLGAPELVRWAAIASGPLALLGLGWLLYGRSARNETTRFIRNVEAMRAQSGELQAVLARVGRDIASNRVALSDETARLMSLGEEAASRLGAVTRDVDAGAQAMARYAEKLDRVAGSARTDMGVLLADIPKAQAQAGAMAETLQAAGLEAHRRAGALEAQVDALAARAREVDESTNGAAARLTAHIAQIESAAVVATGQLDSATAAMSAGIDASFAHASDVVDATRRGIDEQGRAMLALVDQNRAALDRVGVDAAARFSAAIVDIGERMDGLSAQLAKQDTASRTVIVGIDRSMASLEERFFALSDDGERRLRGFSTSVEQLSAMVGQLIETMSAGDAGVGDLSTRTDMLRDALNAVGADLSDTLPAGFAAIEDGLVRTRELRAALAPDMAALVDAATAAHARLGDVEAIITRQRSAFGTLGDTIDAGLSGAHERAAGLDGVLTETTARAERLVQVSGTQLIEALLRVQHAASQAADRARDAIGRVIPEMAAQLGDATVVAMNDAIAERVTAQMDTIGVAAERAVETARSASDRLTRQIVTIGETTAAVESRIAEAQESLRQDDHEQFSRRVALLIESLNSTAIDVTKILSNDVTDGAWAQYLKGDRGVFTRRAVRLLDTGEAREIARHYEDDPEFREQVNRYIADFEGLLRRVLAERDGSPLGVTLLSSDVGKLYVALAQAIERIRGT